MLVNDGFMSGDPCSDRYEEPAPAPPIMAGEEIADRIPPAALGMCAGEKTLLPINLLNVCATLDTAGKGSCESVRTTRQINSRCWYIIVASIPSEEEEEEPPVLAAAVV